MKEKSSFGEPMEVRLASGLELRYREVGSGPALVFVHGLLVNGVLWSSVVENLAESYRCIVPDLPLGAHMEAVGEGVDLGPEGVAGIVAELLDVLDLRDVTLVGNDIGGAICQVLISNDPSRVGRLVLTNCDAYRAFFPWQLGVFRHGPRIFGQRFVDLMAFVLRVRPAQRLLLKIVAKRRIETWELDAYLGSIVRDAGVRRDLTRFLRQVSPRHTLEAARSFGRFQKPVLIVWGEDDPVFRIGLARRLQRGFPDAALRTVTGSRAFVPLDRPDALSEAISGFVPTGEVFEEMKQP